MLSVQLTRRPPAGYQSPSQPSPGFELESAVERGEQNRPRRSCERTPTHVRGSCSKPAIGPAARPLELKLPQATPESAPSSARSWVPRALGHARGAQTRSRRDRRSRDSRVPSGVNASAAGGDDHKTCQPADRRTSSRHPPHWTAFDIDDRSVRHSAALRGEGPAKTALVRRPRLCASAICEPRPSPRRTNRPPCFTSGRTGHAAPVRTSGSPTVRVWAGDDRTR
jgi:hypothetical protein